MRTVSVKSGLFGSTDLHVEDPGGPGRPVVLIHGWPLSGESWSENVPALFGAGFRVITYDRRGFGRSDKPEAGYDYDQFADDLATILEELDLTDVTLVGFSMGGGEVARYLSRHGADRIRSVVFAGAIPPYLLKTDDNPDGPLSQEAADEMAQAYEADRTAFFDEFTTEFFSAEGELKVTESQRQEALALAHQSDEKAGAAAMEAFGTTDFREDLLSIKVPTLIIHGDSDATVPLEGSGQRTHDAVPGSVLHVISGGPHGINVSHAEEFNQVLIEFLQQ